MAITSKAASVTYTTSQASAPTELAPGLFMALPGVATIENVDLEGGLYDVELTLDMTPDGIRPTSVKVTAQAGSPHVTGTTLRAVRVWDLARHAILTGVHRGSSSASDGVTRWDLASPALPDTEIARLRAQGPTEETLTEVALLYNFAGVLGLPPAKFVEVNLEIPRTTASKWVRRAREKGLVHVQH